MKVTVNKFDRDRNEFVCTEVDTGHECTVDPFVTDAMPQSDDDYEKHVKFAQTFVGKTFEMTDFVIHRPCYLPQDFTEVKAQ